jgi:hypothetical protein
MEKIILRFITLSVLLVTTGIAACDDEPTAEEIFLEKLGKVWTADVVTVDDVVLEGAFDGFSITPTKEKTFTTTNGNSPIWPASGSFTLKAVSTGEGFNLIRNDGVEVEVRELTETTLQLKLHYISTGGRSSSVSGDYIFELSN